MATKIYLCVNDNDVVTDIMTTDYEMIHPQRIPWDVADYSLIGKKVTRCPLDICDRDLCDHSCTFSDYVVVEENIVTKLQFRQRFTLAEMSAFYEHEKTDLVVKIILDDLRVSEFIDINDPNTQNAVGYLHNVGIITAERMIEILS